MPVTILHNPRCSKSRQSLELLTNNGVDVQVILYLEDPPTSSEIKNILKKLNLSPLEVLRSGETRFKELAISLEDIDDDQLIELMAENPILIERPIIFNETKAVIGRPPENTLDII